MEDIYQTTEEEVRTLVLGADLGVYGSHMGWWESIKDGPEFCFAPCVGLNLSVGHCVCVCLYVHWGSSQCTLYPVPQPLFLITSTNLSFSSWTSNLPPVEWEEEFVLFLALPNLLCLREGPRLDLYS